MHRASTDESGLSANSRIDDDDPTTCSSRIEVIINKLPTKETGPVIVGWTTIWRRLFSGWLCRNAASLNSTEKYLSSLETRGNKARSLTESLSHTLTLAPMLTIALALSHALSVLPTHPVTHLLAASLTNKPTHSQTDSTNRSLYALYQLRTYTSVQTANFPAKALKHAPQTLCVSRVPEHKQSIGALDDSPKANQPFGL